MKIVLSFLFLLFLSFAIANNDDNYFYFDYGKGVNQLQFVYNANVGYCDGSQIKKVASGINPRDGSHPKQFYVDVVSDTQSSTLCANQFNNLFTSTYPGYSHMYPLGFDNNNHNAMPEPSSLNLFIGGVLYINGNMVTQPVYLAQNARTNNHTPWWIGSNSGTYQYDIDNNGYDKGIMVTDSMGLDYCLDVDNSDHVVNVYYLGNDPSNDLCPLSRYAQGY